MKAVLDTRPRSGYSDSDELYQFPGRYLRIAEAAVGGWVVMYEPRREGGRASYVAVARIQDVSTDATRAGHYVAKLVEWRYFSQPVPLRGIEGYREEHLRGIGDPRKIGQALQGRSVRAISDEDFEKIIAEGFSTELAQLGWPTKRAVPGDALLDYVVAGSNALRTASGAWERPTSRHPEAKIAVRGLDGFPLDSHFHVDGDAIVFHSRGGTMGAGNATNTQYPQALRLILSRLKEAGIGLAGIWVDSSRVQHLPLEERIVVSAAEAAGLDSQGIFALASKRMQAVGSTAKAGGNSNKRIRLGFSGSPEMDQVLALLDGRPVPGLATATGIQQSNAGQVDTDTNTYEPSRGFPMAFGSREFAVEDGEHFLYALQLSGDPSGFLGDSHGPLHGKVIVKVGLAKDPSERCAQLNAGFPPASRVRWNLVLKSASLPGGQAALEAENSLKARFAEMGRSLGGEFFLCEERMLATQFATASRP